MARYHVRIKRIRAAAMRIAQNAGESGDIPTASNVLGTNAESALSKNGRGFFSQWIGQSGIRAKAGRKMRAVALTIWRNPFGTTLVLIIDLNQVTRA